MSLVKMHNKKNGVTYVYESTSYWDKEKKQPRNTRKLVGKIDPVTGEIIPTGNRGRKATVAVDETASETESRIADLQKEVENRDREIVELRAKTLELEARCKRMESALERIRSIVNHQKE